MTQSGHLMCRYALAPQRTADLVEDRGIIDRRGHGPRLAVSDFLHRAVQDLARARLRQPGDRDRQLEGMTAKLKWARQYRGLSNIRGVARETRAPERLFIDWLLEDPFAGCVVGIAGRYTGSYLVRPNGWRAVATLADIGQASLVRRIPKESIRTLPGRGQQEACSLIRGEIVI